MATTKIYFDKRAQRTDGSFPLKLTITQKGKASHLTLGINLRPDQWDGRRSRVINHPQCDAFNCAILNRRAELEAFILKLNMTGEIYALSAKNIKEQFEIMLDPSKGKKRKTFYENFQAFIEKKTGSTSSLYAFTLGKLLKYCPKLSYITYEQITPSWLEGFDNYLAQTAPSKNYRNIHLRNIRAVFNAAIDAEDTSYYPFRKFKIRPVPTRKRSLSLEALRRLFDFPVEEYAEIYRDMFKLIFMLIGINAVDLYGLGEITDEQRVEYKRAKTHRLYSIRVEPEALELIHKYRGKSRLLCIADRWSDHRNFVHQLNKALQSIGAPRSGLGGKKQRKEGAFPGLSSYWARHTWATIAASLDIPKETIAAALGHGGNTVTDIYIDFDQRKVDAANRKVLDWVLYGKQ